MKKKESIKSKIWRFVSVNLIKLWFIKVKKVSIPIEMENKETDKINLLFFTKLNIGQ